MNTKKSFQHSGRQAGRTTKMVEQIVEEITNGQPYCAVIGYSLENARDHLLPMVREKLNATGIMCQTTNAKLEWSGSVVEFFSINNLHGLCGKRGSEFYDHFAVENAIKPGITLNFQARRRYGLV